MSPSEFELRAALHEGEGDGVDAGLLIANANRIRRERRRRINAGIGVAAVVGVLGSFGVLIATRSNSEQGGGAAGGVAVSEPVPGGYAGARSSSGDQAGGGRLSALPSPAPASSARRYDNGKSAAACPSRPEHVKRPGGVSQTEGSLFPPGVSSISACAYPATGTSVSGAFVTGTAAQSLARSLESAPDNPATAGSCVSPFDGRGTLQLRVYDSSGALVAPLTVVPSCRNATVSNGTVTKYPRHLPPPLPRLLRAVR